MRGIHGRNGFSCFLDKGITIDDSFMSMRPCCQSVTLWHSWKTIQIYSSSGFLGIPPTDDWETYKVAYIDKLVNDHIRMREAVEQIERGKKAVERANAQIKHSKKQIERAKAQAEQSKEQVKLAIERSKETIERAKAQLERSTEQLERAQKELNSQQSVHLKKQIESVRGTLEPPKPPKEPTPPQEPK